MASIRVTPLKLRASIMKFVLAVPPLEFKDTARGEHFDVVQDRALSPNPSDELGDEARRERVIAHAERRVQGGQRGPTVPPA